MNRTIPQDDLAVLRYLDERADELRRRLDLHQRGEVITWYEDCGGERQYEAVADGFGRFNLIAYEGRNPNDRLVHHQATYDDEEAAWLAAMRLGEYGVAWDDRDAPVPGELEETGWQPPPAETPNLSGTRSGRSPRSGSSEISQPGRPGGGR